MTELGALSTRAIAQAAQGGCVLAVPLGATEQHGPHLPVSTDTDIALALCRELAECRDVLVAPPVHYGSSGEHDGFAGTLSIGQHALEELVVELCRSASATFSRIVLICGHGGNAEPLARAARRLEHEGRHVLAFTPRWDGDPHAGGPETALQLALHPDSVHMEHAEVGDLRPLAEILPALKSGGVRAVSANGVLGDPRGATAAEGHALLDRLAADLLHAVNAWLESVPA